MTLITPLLVMICVSRLELDYYQFCAVFET